MQLGSDTKTPDPHEIRLFLGAKLFHPFKIVSCPPCNSIQWTKRAYPLKDITRVAVLPAIVRVETGYLGQGNIDSVSSGQVAVIQGVYKQKRVIAVPVCQNRSHYLSFPLVGYFHKFSACKSEASGSPEEIKFDEAATLDSIVRKAKLPVHVRFSDDKLHTEYGLLRLVHVYEEVYLYGHGATGDGSLYAEVLFMPLYLEVTLSVAEGLRDGNTNDWNIFKNAYVNVSAAFLKGSFSLGYSDMAMFDGSWDDSQSRAREWEPRRAGQTKPVGKGKANGDSLKIGRVDHEDSGDDSDDDYHSYVSPSDYIKFTHQPAVISNARAPAEYVKVEGLHGVIGREIAHVLEALEKDSSFLSAGISPPPRPPKAKPTLVTNPVGSGNMTSAVDEALVTVPRQRDKSTIASPLHLPLGRLPPPTRPLPATPKNRAADSAQPDSRTAVDTADDIYERVESPDLSPSADNAPAVAEASTQKATYYYNLSALPTSATGGSSLSAERGDSAAAAARFKDGHSTRIGDYDIPPANPEANEYRQKSTGRAEAAGRTPLTQLKQCDTSNTAAATAFTLPKQLASVPLVWKLPDVSQGPAVPYASPKGDTSKVSEVAASVASQPHPTGHKHFQQLEERAIREPADIPQDFSALTHKELCQCFRVMGLHSCADAFQRDGVIDGCLLMAMDAAALREHFHFTQYDAVKVIKFAKEGWRPR